MKKKVSKSFDQLMSHNVKARVYSGPSIHFNLKWVLMMELFL